MVLFENLLSRADETTLNQMIGENPVRLMSLLDPRFSSAAEQQKLLLSLKSPHELLDDNTIRSEILQLLRPNEAEKLCQVLGMSEGGNPYDFLAAEKFANKDKQHLLHMFFGLPQREDTSLPARSRYNRVSADYPLFPHQIRACKEVSYHLGADPFRVLLHMPTGSGKTRTAMHIIANHLRLNGSTLVVWLAHSEELCEQAAEEFERAWSHLGNREVGVIRFWGSENTSLKDIRDGFIVVGFQKLLGLLKKDSATIGLLMARISLVVMDEAHQAMAPTYKMILDSLVDPNRQTRLLGLSATPGRSWDMVDLDAELADVFCRRKVTLSVEGYSNPVDYLVEEGYLARAHFRPLLHDPGFQLGEADLRTINSTLELPYWVLKELADDEQRNLLIVREVEFLLQNHRRVIVFSVSVDHSDLLAAVLKARGVNAASITSKTGMFERSRLLSEFKEDTADHMVLCNYGVLTTGFDAPITSAAVITRPTTSLVLFSQMVGRAIRGPKAGGNALAEIVTVTDQGLPGFGDVADAFFNWEDVWERDKA